MGNPTFSQPRRRDAANRLLLALVTCLLLLVASRGMADDAMSLQRFARTELHMAVEFEVVLYAPDQAAADRAFAAAFDRIAKLNRVMSDYDAESELSRLSASAGSGRPVSLSDDLFAILTASKHLSATSDGAFDVTVGPLTKLWRRARRQRELPSDERIAEARAAVGDKLLELNRDQQAATLLKAGMRLDLGGIAKGYAADGALQAIRETGITRALVRGSGDIVAGDPPPGKEGWKVGLAPLDAEATPERFISITNAAVSTSGDSRQHLVVDGKRYSHIIDPRTGTPVEGRSSVSVIAPTGILADSLASAVSVLGPEAGLKLVEATDGAAALIVSQPSDDVQPTTYTSKRFASFETAP